MREYKPGEMLDKLYDSMSLLERLLPCTDKWDSLIINRRKPYTYRVFTTLPNGLRLCVHKFEPCTTDEAFLHPHPWPGAFIIVEGAYRMSVGLSKLGRLDNSPQNVATFDLYAGSSYEIIDPNTWHSVTPLTTTYTVMVNDEAWPKEYAHSSVKTTKGKDLEKMSDEDLTCHLRAFYMILSDDIELQSW